MEYIPLENVPIDMKLETGLEGFPFSYGSRLADVLNESVRGRNFNNQELLEIGKSVSEDVIQPLNLETKDGYHWHGGLEFKVGNARIAILFPWGKDYDPETGKGRSIEIYSDRELSNRIVWKLLVSIAHQANLKFPLRDEKGLH